ncbi:MULTISPECIES: xanthine dehydrogenase family Fe-S subunit [unclassified Nocardioides]|uniref:xanthine dehydrogenase family Fe-S subunit n=1 Tax=unclassified Nocardioides TaxID=2615069 RepID=UPI0009EF95BF|nr:MULTISPECIES: 2Fe-2S iron-sulfur cluster-binding protein [unclassified Nocardioides]GAW51816.1 (2Fe-2S)-binding protein [Nocardioides sp. PD653-B2]GAW57275.1 (2Fe-2S)-binding protein [Nocardioides sp. PD653]
MNLPTAQSRTASSDTVEVNLSVNGSSVSMSLPARVTLSDALRDHLGLTGTHVGCEHGICGMCTVLVDGEAARACLLFAVQLDGAEVTTVEGLGRQDDLHPLQESFGRHHALQCGFCTPGFLMSSYDLLSHEPEITREDLPSELSGVLCRCTGYRNIIDAVDDVAENFRGGLPAPGNCGSRTLVGRTPAGSTGTASTDTTEDVDPTHGQGHPERINLPTGEPTIAIDLTSALTSSPADVARVMGDVRLLARCLPGAELTDVLGDDWYLGRAQVALGPVRLSFQGMAHVLEQSPERIAINAQGKDTGGGSAQARIVMVAEPSASGTSLHAEASVYLTGRIAGFGRSLAGDVSRRMFEDFARAIDQAAAGVEPDAAAAPPSGFTLLAAAVGGRIRARYQRVRVAARRRFGRSGGD